MDIKRFGSIIETRMRHTEDQRARRNYTRTTNEQNYFRGNIMIFRYSFGIKKTIVNEKENRVCHKSTYKQV